MSKRSLVTSLPPKELERILRRIDENLALRPLFHDNNDEQDDDIVAAPDAPPLPNEADLSLRVQTLQQIRAPLFAVTGRDLKNQVRRGVNALLRILNHKQIRHNQAVVDLLGQIVVHNQMFRRHAEHTERLAYTAFRQRRRIQELEAAVQTLTEQVGRQQQQIQSLKTDIERLDHEGVRSPSD